MGLETAAILGLTSAATAGATAGAGIYGANKQSSSADKAAKAAQASNAEALALERENEQRRRFEWDQTQAENERRWNIEADREERRWGLDQNRQNCLDRTNVAQWNAEQRRLQPYRDTSIAAIRDLAARAGLTVQVTPAPQLSGPPAGGTPIYMADLLKREAATTPKKASA